MKSDGRWARPRWCGGAATASVGAWLMAAGLGAGLAMPAAALAQPVVQPLPAPDNSHALDAALARLARNPRDGEALLAAGEAALGLGDLDAASGFLMRADRLEPGNPRVELALATARLRADDAPAAIGLYDAAEKHQPVPVEQLADRGLAHDLVGDNLTAQRYYRQALAAGPNDTAAERLAVSLAIYGDRRGVEAALAPLLQKQNRSAWRTRAFAFAILGREDEAAAIARSTMPAEMANAIEPYLRYMRQLTPAQQAAAANLGRFPRASDIGRDDPRLIAWAAAHGVHHVAYAEPAASGPAAPVAHGKERRKKEHKLALATPAAPEDEPREAPEAPPPGEPAPSRQPAAVAARPVVSPSAAASASAASAPVSSVPAASVPPASVAVKPALVGPPAPAVASPTPTAPAPVASAPVQPAPVLAASAPATPPAVEAAPAPRVVPHPAPRPHRASFAEAFSAWTKADAAPVAASGAVDLRKIVAPRPAPKAPLPPKYPSRIWVQVGVGRSAARIAYDWHKMEKEEPKLLKGRQAWMADWGRTNRFLIGPFDDEEAASAFVEKAKKAGRADAFLWKSDEGQEVDPL